MRPSQMSVMSDSSRLAPTKQHDQLPISAEDLRGFWLVDLFLLCLILPIWLNAGPLAMSNMRLLLMLAVIPLTINIFTGKYGKPAISDICFPLFVLWATAAMAVNNPGQAVQHIGSVGVEFIGGYVVGRACIRTPAAFQKLCRRLVLIVLFSIPFAIFEALTARPLLVELLGKLPVVSSLQNMASDQRLGLDRVQFAFSHPIQYGLFCSMVFALSIGLKTKAGSFSKPLISTLIALAGFLALTSAALMAMAAQLGLLIWNRLFRGVRSRWWILIALTICMYFFIDLASNRTPIHVFFTYATFNPHNGYWRMTILEWGMHNIRLNPMFGIGLNDWIRPIWMHSSSVDNFWLLHAMRYGIPGFVFLIAGYFPPLIRIAMRNFSDAPAVASLRLAWVFMFIGTTLVLITVHIWGSIYAFVFFAFGAGIWFLNYHPDTTRIELSQENTAPNRISPQFSRDFGGQVASATQDPPPVSTNISFTRFADEISTEDSAISGRQTRKATGRNEKPD